MRIKNSWLKITILLSSVFLLTGCMSAESRTKAIDLQSGNIWEKYVVGGLARLMDIFMDSWGLSLGVAIIVITLLVRLVFTPVYLKGNSSMQKQQEIQPYITALNKKYENKKDPQSRSKKQQELMQIYREHKINPCGSCFWALLQMPIFLAMYNLMVRFPHTYGYVKDKSDFLLWDLSQSDKFPYILVILVGATMFFMQWINMYAMNKKKSSKDKPAPGSPEAMSQSMMKAMMYAMPIMMATFAFTQPASLSLYWIIGNTFVIVQTIIVRKPFKKEDEQLKLSN